MTLSDVDILTELKKVNAQLKIEPLKDIDEQIQPASVDLRLADTVKRFDSYGILVDSSLDHRPSIMPGEFLLASTIECITVPDYLVGELSGKSSLGRLGLQVENAGFFDPGFEGQATLELVNFSPNTIILKSGMYIVQICFKQLLHPSIRPYGHKSRESKYKGQKGPTPSKL